ncbi:MAG: zinc-dependent metalloprotease [Bacteroidota bacterium]|nr:zinc-dependent metalloprotease [Bacteroidota bacterium]
MKPIFHVFASLLVLALFFSSCQQDDSAAIEKTIPKEVLDRIWDLGYSNENVQKVDEGYMVEGDIILTQENLDDHIDHLTLRIAETEQYRTSNLVEGLPRTITVSVDTRLTDITGYSEAVNEAIARYNAKNLQLTFLRQGTSGGQIHLKKANGNFLASAGFPSGGNPYNLIKINAQAIGSGGSSTFINFCATIMAHEMGHCIGFRHTDYMDRSYSCGGAASNEGSAGVGAIQIPGTPSGPDAGSFMLACISLNQNRPFNSNDGTALNYLY